MMYPINTLFVERLLYVRHYARPLGCRDGNKARYPFRKLSLLGREKTCPFIVERD